MGLSLFPAGASSVRAGAGAGAFPGLWVMTCFFLLRRKKHAMTHEWRL